MPDSPSPSRPDGDGSRHAHDVLAIGCLFGLIFLQTVMLAALFAGTEPHPPAHLAPFIGAGVAVGMFALPLVWNRMTVGYAAAILFGLFSLMSYGPHKLFVEEAAQILAAVVVGFALTCVLLVVSVAGMRRASRPSAN